MKRKGKKILPCRAEIRTLRQASCPDATVPRGSAIQSSEDRGAAGLALGEVPHGDRTRPGRRQHCPTGTDASNWVLWGREILAVWKTRKLESAVLLGEPATSGSKKCCWGQLTGAGSTQGRQCFSPAHWRELLSSYPQENSRNTISLC